MCTRLDSGVATTVAKIRAKSWILKAHILAKTVKFRCVPCREREHKLESWLIYRNSDLPHTLHHSTTRHDYFCPYPVKVGRNKTTKHYGIMSTCLNTRAAHLEVAVDYSTMEFLQALRRFFAIRGYPSMMISDNGTQLVGAERELRDNYDPIGDSQITPSSQARNLGVIFDSTMTLKPHISNIVRVSSFHIRNISRIRKYLNQSAAEQIIHAFVTSRLDNGNALFYGLPQNQISRLQHIQNTAARVVTLSRKSCHITPILKELHWLPVSQRIVFKLMLIVHKSVNNIAPIYISELLKVYTPSRNLRSSNMSLLKEPTSKRTWGDRSFSVAAPRLWNHLDLPTKVKSCHSITRFKSLLKTHLMSQFFKDDVYL